ncbi:MAG: Gfo/Idh/MocA family oxidoreductase [Firmicutes bacterium]|nr:Gfo/Idh/MocA family oxidoreductase [Bacillota bacterium]
MTDMKLGVIGAGAISDIYVSNMKDRFRGIEIAAIGSRGMKSAEAAAEKHGLRAASVDEMLADPEIEMCVILTPVGSHYELIKRSLKAGKHVYTEKTLTDDPAAAEELLKLAQEKGLQLGSAPDTFLGSSLQTARKAVDSGMLGDIHSFAVSSTRCNDYFASRYPFLREPGCGLLYDYAVYYVTALVSLLGPAAMVCGTVENPYSVRKNIFRDSPDFGKSFSSPNESQVCALMRMKSGVMGTLHIDADNTLRDEAYFRIYGSGGTLVLGNPNDFGGVVSFIPAARQPEEKPSAALLEPVSPLSDNCRGIGPAEMAAAIREGRPCRTDARMAYHVLDVLSSILDSAERDNAVFIRSSCERPRPLEAEEAEALLA